jgi:hypothetical protein
MLRALLKAVRYARLLFTAEAAVLSARSVQASVRDRVRHRGLDGALVLAQEAESADSD